MAYRAPGVYAAFQRTAAAPVNVGTSRIMALIGTGIDYYSVVNEGVARNSDKPYDVLRHENVFELTVSSRPVYVTKNNPYNGFIKSIIRIPIKERRLIIYIYSL